MKKLIATFLSLGILACGAPTPNGCKVGDSTCAPVDGGTGFLPNGSFEVGNPPTGWYAVSGNLETAAGEGRNGTNAAKLIAPTSAAATSLWPDGTPVTSPGTNTYCARAWVKKGTANDARIEIKRMTGTAGTNETYSAPVENEWTVIPPADYGPLEVKGNNEDKLLFRIFIPNAQAGDTLLVDDIEFWQASTGDNCKAPH